MTVNEYMGRRSAYEPALWAGFLFLNWLANAWVSWTDVNRAGLSFEFWEVAVWEGTSAIVMLGLVPLVLLCDRRFPLRRDAIWPNLAMHFLCTVPFSAIHVLGMVGLRKLFYGWADSVYTFGDLQVEMIYEYLKDLRSYFVILALAYLYRFVLRRIQGEAGFLMQGREENEPEPITDRFLVKKLGREFLVRVADIDWIESSGNYVNLHVGGRVYPLRETMASIDARLAAQDFLRVHRSAIVNLRQVAEIVPFETGDGEVRLVSSDTVPISRRYRKQLKERLA